MVIVIDDPRTGRAHLEFPDPEAVVPKAAGKPGPGPGEGGGTRPIPRAGRNARPK